MKELLGLAILLLSGATAALGQATAGSLQCRDLALAGNFVGPDETLIDGRVCKVVKPNQIQKSTSTLVAVSAPPQAPVMQNGDLTNSRVVEMTKMGLDDEIIISKIKNGNCNFQLADSDLVDLKKAGVSSRVVGTMLDSSALTQPQVTVDKKLVTLHTLGMGKIGGRLGHVVTLRVKSIKEKAYLDGQHSSVTTGSGPFIGIDLPKGETIDNYILVQLDGKSDRRELEVEARGGIVGQKNGIRAESIRKTSANPLGGNKFQLATGDLKRGEYLIYIVGSPDANKGIYGKGYDFTVE
jgi:hypothetical protein